MKVTNLNRIKRCVLQQCQYPSGKWRDFAKKHSSLIKQVLSFGSLVKVIDSVTIHHVEGTKTSLLTRETADGIMDRINQEFGHNVIRLHSDLFQKMPDNVTEYTLTTDNVGEVMKHIFSNGKRHQLKKLKRDPVQKAKRQRNRVKQAVTKYNQAKRFIDAGDSFLCFDVECFEFRQTIVLEIGYTTFKDGEMQTHHFIIAEHERYKNKRYVPNNRDNFLFGESQRVCMREAIHHLNKAIRKHDCIVGHSIGGDVDSLVKHGLKIDPSKKFIDTAVIGKAVLKQDKSRPSLADIAELCDIEMQFAHNGGNDSRYNMEAFVSLFKQQPVVDVAV